jgi:adenine-specific DNA-methyltransferase
MKYMGSKRQMLNNGLGNLIRAKASDAKRVVDLFCGSAAVTWYAAENTNRPVLAVDLQHFSAVLAQSVISRTKAVNPAVFARKWLTDARHTQWKSEICYDAFALEHSLLDIENFGIQAKELCLRSTKPITNAYGGFYYGPMQALALDALREHLPIEEPQRSICLATLISAASKCAAAPGHTAQPLSPSKTSEKSIRDAWRKDPFVLVYTELVDICKRAANRIGQTMVANALDIASTLNRHDLVFVDPPYSGVQYSRFYHVLETVTLWKPVQVSGTGRYPPFDQRPQSDFSNKGGSVKALRDLLEGLAESRATVLFTFPNTECSNGLSGQIVRDTAEKFFNVKSKLIFGRFSTLGGNNFLRKSRLKSEELILTLTPKSRALTRRNRPV